MGLREAGEDAFAGRRVRGLLQKGALPRIGAVSQRGLEVGEGCGGPWWWWCSCVRDACFLNGCVSYVVLGVCCGLHAWAVKSEINLPRARAWRENAIDTTPSVNVRTVSHLGSDR